jgi:hypothetical protein
MMDRLTCSTALRSDAILTPWHAKKSNPAEGTAK